MNKPGVYAARKKDNSIYYRASITHRNKHISLGSYPHAADAHRAYLEAQQILNGAGTIAEYRDVHSIPFEKYIILINFRDTGLYFKTPIYLHPHHFEYYLDRDCVLLFDRDDLFFYASHKIMRRGNRLFYCDFGNQYGILSRYGLKSYAVAGRDYRFVNGNPHDFRYANIQAINIYTGVQTVTVDGKTRYQVRIHVNGNYQVGLYDDEETAAIAYNKAADVLKQNGIQKQFVRNYLTRLSSHEYRQRYEQVVISKKLYTVTPPVS